MFLDMPTHLKWLNGKFTSNNKASPIEFEMQISLHRQAPPNISPSKNKPLKKGLWKI